MTLYNQINFGQAHKHEVLNLAQAYFANGIPKINKADTGLMGWARRYAKYLKVRHQQRKNRAEFSKLLIAHDTVFHDLGVSYSDVKWAASLPIEINSADALETLKNLKSQNLKAAVVEA